MISFYRITFVVSLVVALASCLLLSTSGMSIDRKLSMRPEDWTLTFHTPDRNLMGLDETGAKSLLLAFIHVSRDEKIHVRGLFTITCLTAAIFSFIGWRRELFLEKHAKRRTDGAKTGD